jgi:hypothetical protein
MNKCPETSQAMEEFARQALLEVHPEAVLVGHSVLHGNGWTTQPCRRIQLAVLPKKTDKGPVFARDFYALGDFDLFGVHEAWFQLLEPWTVDPAKCLCEYHEITTYGYRALLPAAAFVEQFSETRAGDRVMLDPDDFDPDELFEAREILLEISQSLSVKLPKWAFPA